MLGILLLKKKEINKELYKILEGFSNKKIILTNANQNERRDYGIIEMLILFFSLNHDPENRPKIF